MDDDDAVLVGAGSVPLFQGSRPASARLRSARSRTLGEGSGASAGSITRHGAGTGAGTGAAGGAGAALTSEEEGPFWFEAAHNVVVDGKRVHRGITTRERQQLRELVKSGFFSEDVLRNIVVKLNDESSDTPRLRAYDWAVTNYAKGHPMTMLVQKADGGGADVVDPNLAYEGELRKLHRLLFDPFRRGTHVFFEMDGIIHRSTAGQLTFIKWCLENNVDKYVEANLAMIRMHMARATKRKAAAATSPEEDASTSSPAAKRRRELTKAPTRMVRGVLMTAFDITTDTDRELRASKAANLAARASELAHALGKPVDDSKGRDAPSQDCDDEDMRKALELAQVLLDEAEPDAASALPETLAGTTAASTSPDVVAETLDTAGVGTTTTGALGADSTGAATGGAAAGGGM